MSVVKKMNSFILVLERISNENCHGGERISSLLKTGGLADVVYSLSKQLVKTGQEVSIILPMFDT